MTNLFETSSPKPVGRNRHQSHVHNSFTRPTVRSCSNVDTSHCMARYLVGIFANLGPTWPSSSLSVKLHQWEDPRSFHQTPRLLTFLHFDGPSNSTISNCIEGMLRNYATVASKPFSRLRARGKSPVGLDHVCNSDGSHDLT